MTMIFDGTAGITLPSGAVSNTTSTVVGISDTQTLTNKSLVASQLTGTQTIPRGTLPTGSVLQVVTATYNTTTSSSSGTQADTGLTATITPTSATSKILVLTSCRIFAQPGTPASVILLRNSTNLQQRYRYGLTDASGAGSGDQFSTAYLDSPTTTSATTYKVTFARQSGTGVVYAQLDTDISTMTLMEISA
jgi:hypothetical protein